MGYQSPYEKEDIPQDRPPGQASDQYPQQPHDYSSEYGRPSTDELIKRSYPKGRGGIERFLKTDKLVMLIALGLFLMFLGAIIITVVTTARPPAASDYDLTELDKYYDDIKGYEDRRSLGVMLGGIIIEFGLLVLACALLGGGILNKDLDNNIRIGMLLAAGVIIAFELLFLSALIQSAPQSMPTIEIPTYP